MFIQKLGRLGILAVGAWVISACITSTPPTSVTSVGGGVEYRIITLLPKDGIRSIDNPRFLDVVEADLEYDADELIIGVEFDGEARAYSIDLLSRREIVNDEVQGRPIAVTW
jgi:hypothetical protein